MNDDDAKIEALLGRYRPVGPPAELRARVLASATPRRSRWSVAGWLAVAAMLIVSLGLDLAADSITDRTVAMLGSTVVEWTPEAEETANLINGDGWGRRYLALALAADAHRPSSFPPTLTLPDTAGGM